MDKIKVLIVEDEAMVALEIQRAITKMDYIVTTIVTNYDDALRSIRQNRPDILLLDIHLKYSLDGIEIAQKVHESDPIPIIYLTSDNSEQTIIRAAQTHPAAYLCKPFRREGLYVNLMIASHRCQNTPIPETLLQPLGNGYTFDHTSQNIYYQDHPIYLSDQEKIFLHILIEARGYTVPYAVLDKHIWGSTPPKSDNRFRSLLYRLRSKLESLEIETMARIGYRLIMDSK